MTEHNLQSAAFNYVALSFPKYSEFFFAIPNGGARSARTGAMLKREGVKRGIPDTMLAVPKRGYHGLFIELKRPDVKGKAKARTSAEQLMYIELFQSVGYLVRVVNCIEEFIELVEWYLNETR